MGITVTATPPRTEPLTDEELAQIQQENWVFERSMAYPDIKDQLDMLYWDGINGTTTWADAIAEAKASTPKP